MMSRILEILRVQTLQMSRVICLISLLSLRSLCPFQTQPIQWKMEKISINIQMLKNICIKTDPNQCLTKLVSWMRKKSSLLRLGSPKRNVTLWEKLGITWPQHMAWENLVLFSFDNCSRSVQKLFIYFHSKTWRTCINQTNSRIMFKRLWYRLIKQSNVSTIFKVI